MFPDTHASQSLSLKTNHPKNKGGEAFTPRGGGRGEGEGLNAQATYLIGYFWAWLRSHLLLAFAQHRSPYRGPGLGLAGACPGWQQLLAKQLLSASKSIAVTRFCSEALRI